MNSLEYLFVPLEVALVQLDLSLNEFPADLTELTKKQAVSHLDGVCMDVRTAYGIFDTRAAQLGMKQDSADDCGAQRLRFEMLRVGADELRKRLVSAMTLLPDGEHRESVVRKLKGVEKYLQTDVPT